MQCHSIFDSLFNVLERRQSLTTESRHVWRQKTPLTHGLPHHMVHWFVLAILDVHETVGQFLEVLPLVPTALLQHVDST